MNDMHVSKYNLSQFRLTIHSRRCAAFLMEREHELINTIPDKRRAGSSSYVFRNSLQLNEDVEEFKYMRKMEQEQQQNSRKNNLSSK